ncbi:MAG: hypothetical protein E4G91_03510 [Candidatus Zixiibacteriota bacterium]|nr:MAG: hypothetical protein E4G91_03510 [candidate division Zixibacteria bacterium]
MRIKQTALMWFVAIVVLVGGGSLQAESFNGTGVVFIDPATKQVQLDETFDLYIAIDENVKYFKTFEYDIEVDTNVIQMIAAAREPFFSGPDINFFTWKDTVKTFPQIGSRYVYEMLGSIFGYEIYVDGPGQVVKMTFKAVGNGVSDVIFRYIYMSNWHDSTMSIQDSLSGLVVVCPLTNQPPVANAGRDSTLYQCTPAAISITAGCTDPDGNLSTCLLTSGTGIYDGSHITFTPTGSGTYTFILKATDSCLVTDYDTSVVNVTANQAPVANAGRDSTLFQCTPAAISIAAGCTDPNGNLSTCVLAPGSSTGTYNGSNITFTPTGSGTYTFILKATDVCEVIDYDTSVVNVTVNQPPVANAGRDSTLSQTTPAPISIVAGCADLDVNPAGSLSTCLLTSGTGTYNGSNITFTPTGIGTYTFILKATDLCGLTDFDTSVVNVMSSYHCGDANGDGGVDISDVVYLIAYIFSGGAAPDPLLAGDANCDGGVDISDAVYLISFIFSGGSAPCGPCNP